MLHPEMRIRENYVRRLEKRLKEVDPEAYEYYLQYPKTSLLNRENILVDLMTLCTFLRKKGKTISRVTVSDVREYYLFLRSRGYRAATIKRKLDCIHALFNFLKIKPKVRRITGEYLRKLRKEKKKEELEGVKQKLVTRREFDKLFNTIDKLKYKALLCFIYETGARIAEAVMVKLRDVKVKHEYIEVKITGKTGPRVVYIISYSGVLLQWLSNHADRDNPDAFLFYGKNPDEPLKPHTFRVALAKYCERAGIRRIHPHMLRHTRATELAGKIPEPVLKKYFGWTPGSNMVEIYTHLSGRDVKNAYLGLFGLKTGEEEVREEYKKCPRCGQINPPNAKFCLRCGQFLEEEAVFRIQGYYPELSDAASKMTVKGLEGMINFLITFIRTLARENPGEFMKMMNVFKEFLGEI